jgi:hypothetical protein
MNSKKGAIELSMSTVVIIVLAMTLLIGGLVLVRNIVSGANQVVDLTNDNVLKEINSLFSEGDKIIVKLGNSKTAKVKANNEPEGIVIASTTIDGDIVAIEDMAYLLKLDDSSLDNCLELLGEEKTLALFNKKFGKEIEFDSSDGSMAAAQITVKIPEGTRVCSQMVKFDVYDGGEFVGRDYFVVEVARNSLF